MNKKFYVILPIIAFLIILVNAFFGHLLFDFDSEQNINKYSIYVHLQPDWKSYPGNILFDVTTVWTNPIDTDNNPYFESIIDPTLKTNYNANEIQNINGKSFVELKHEFSDCKNEWKPILYRHLVDSARSQINHIMGLQINSEPYVVVYPKIINKEYGGSEQEIKIKSGYTQFIPICTSNNVTSYDYSVTVNDEKLGIDVYFVSSIEQLEKYHQHGTLEYYPEDGCHGKNVQRFSGTCKNVQKQSGLVIIIPDGLNLALTKVTVNLHENLI